MATSTTSAGDSINLVPYPVPDYNSTVPSNSPPQTSGTEAAPRPADATVSLASSSTSAATVTVANTSLNNGFQTLHQATSLPTWTTLRKWFKSPTAANIYSICALIVSFTVGVGAWWIAAKSYQVSKSGLDLTRWTTCKEHINDPNYKELETSKLCQELLAKGFDNVKTKIRKKDEIHIGIDSLIYKIRGSEPRCVDFDSVLIRSIVRRPSFTWLFRATLDRHIYCTFILNSLTSIIFYSVAIGSPIRSRISELMILTLIIIPICVWIYIVESNIWVVGSGQSNHDALFYVLIAILDTFGSFTIFLGIPMILGRFNTGRIREMMDISYGWLSHGLVIVLGWLGLKPGIKIPMALNSISTLMVSWLWGVVHRSLRRILMQMEDQLQTHEVYISDELPFCDRIVGPRPRIHQILTHTQVCAFFLIADTFCSMLYGACTLYFFLNVFRFSLWVMRQNAGKFGVRPRLGTPCCLVYVTSLREKWD